MKKILSIFILGLLLFSYSGLFIIQSSAEKNELPILATHTILGEYGTATWCGYCKYAHGALKEIYKNDWYDFYYVSLVCDVNTHSANRASQLGLTAYPTVYWDGNYINDEGAGSIESAMATYNSSINTCETRTVANIGLSISTTWLGSAMLSITVTVNNNEGTTYNGYLRCYVTQTASSMGWYDTGGHLYTFPFLDYAFDQAISISPSGSWSNTVTWDGNLHNDGNGNTFSSITEDNTFIIASVFDSTTGYVDETSGKRVGNNRQPDTPASPYPSNGAENVELNPTLTWECTDPDWFDDLYFDVYFEKGDSTPDVLVSNHQTATSYIPGTLDMESTYYWKIVAYDDNGASKTSPIWSFTTKENNPPNTPKNPNPANNATNINIKPTLSWVGGDPNGDTVTYDVYFESGNQNPTTIVSNDQTGTTYKPSQLEYLTTYYWKIVAEDTLGEIKESPIWSFTTMKELYPNLECSGSLSWSKVKPGAIVNSVFNIQNIGDPASELNWVIEEYPEWGTWTFNPDHEDALTPEDGVTSVQVSVVAPLDEKTDYTGVIKIINVNDPTDNAILQVTLNTPRDKSFQINILERILEKFPNAFLFFKIILGI